MPRMKIEELKSLLGKEVDQAYGADSGQLAHDVSEALDYYHGKPFGNEEDGKSQVI